MSLGSITERAPGVGPSTVNWVAGTMAALLLWGLVYSQLVPFSEWVVSLAPIDPTSHLARRGISMKDIKVLGPGCKRCIAAAEMVQAEADRLGVSVTIEKMPSTRPNCSSRPLPPV